MAVVAVARACGVTVTLLSVFILTVMYIPTVSATTTTRLYLTGERSSDAFLCVDDPLDDAADALQPINPDAAFTAGPLWDGNYWDGTPGFVYWANVTSASVGTYGTAYLKLDVSDIDMEGYWSVDCYMFAGVFHGEVPYTTADDDGASLTTSWDDNLSISVGFGVAGSTPSEGWDPTAWILGGTAGTPVESTATTHNFTGIENDDHSRPWSTDEINDGFLIIEMVFNEIVWGRLTGASQSDPPVSLAIASVRIQIQSQVYTPPPVPSAYSFILYPNADISNYQWHPVPTDDLFDDLNETTYHGDGLTTYVRAAWDYLANYRFEFDDPPDDALTGTSYAVTAFMVAKENATNTVDELGLHIGSLVYSGSAFTPWVLAEESLYYDLSTSWVNYSAGWIRPGGDQGVLTTTNWSLSQLANVTGRLNPTGSDPYGGICVTQVALLCTPTSVIPATEIPGEGMIGWIADGGIQTILGVMGALMLVGGPLIMVVKGRDDDTFAGIFLGILIIVFGIGFLYAGLAGHWGEAIISLVLGHMYPVA